MTKIQLRRDTAANWESVNPVLAEGEIGIDLTNNKFKIGNGTDTYSNLPYASGDAETLTAQSPLEIEDNYSAQITTSSNITYDTSTGSITTAFTETYEGGWIRFELPDNLNINALTDYWRFGTKTQSLISYLNQMYSNANVVEIVDEDDNLVSRVWYGSGSYRKGVSTSQGNYSVASNNEIMYHVANDTGTHNSFSPSENFSQGITIANKKLKHLQIYYYCNNNTSNIGVGTFNHGTINSLSDIRIFTSADDTEGILLEPTVNGKSIKLNVGSGLDVQDGDLVNLSYTKNEVDGLLTEKQDILSAGDGISISSGLSTLPNDFTGSSPLITYDGVESGYEAYKAFDGNPSTYWGGDDYDEHWIMRQHASIVVKSVSMSFREANERFTQGEIQGSNDGTTFTTLASFSNNNNLSITIDCSGNTTAYTYTRIVGTPASGWGKVGEINIQYSNASVSVNHSDDFVIEDGKLALGDTNPNYKYSNIEPPLTLIEEEGVPYKSAIIDSTDNTFSLSGSAATDSMSKQAASLVLHTDSDMRIDKTKLITSSFHTQAEISEYTDSYVYANSVADMQSRSNVFVRTPILGYTQPNGIFIPVLYSTSGSIYEVASVSNMAYDSTTGLTTYTLVANSVGDINSSLLNYDECDMVTLQLKDRNDNIAGFRVQFTKCLNGSQIAYANTLTSSTTPYATLLSKINTVVYPCHCSVNSYGGSPTGDIGINTVAEYEQAIYYTPTPLRTVEDFGIKSTKLGLAYDKTIFRVDSAGYLTDIN